MPPRARSLLVAAVAPALLLSLAPAASAAPPPPVPDLRLTAASGSVVVDRYPDSPGVFLDLGTYVVAGRTPLEIRVTRESYRKPVVATRVIRSGSTVRSRPLPAGLVTDFTGLRRFLRVTLTDSAGRKVLDRYETFCPNAYGSARTRPDAPARSPYPWSCSGNPFALGDVWGIQQGWSASALSAEDAEVDLRAGTYTAKVAITPTYRKLFGIPAGQAATTVKVTVRTVTDGPGAPGHGHATARTAAAATAAADRPGPRRAGTNVPAGPRMTRAAIPAGPRPDLRALPAYGITTMHEDGSNGSGPRGDYLAFAANVWNAGPSPLVVDGFRRPGKDLMDAYQYFYDTRGRQVGWAPTGTLEYDVRDGHEHWHFTDFAGYTLLRADKKTAARSGKEAFCLAPTDAIDLTVRGANWKPGSTGLETACGDSRTLAIRETLDVGWGDTYSQFVPGQSFDISTLPNGTYYIKVAANPDNRLYETNVRNNVSLRKVVLGGRPGARTVTVPPYEGIKAP